MKLEFLFMPTADMTQSLALYRDGLGFSEAWREGDTTVALVVPGSDVQLMLDSNDPAGTPGPVFVVEGVLTFHADRPTALAVLTEPTEIPGGFLAMYQDPSGIVLQVMDQSTDGTT